MEHIYNTYRLRASKRCYKMKINLGDIIASVVILLLFTSGTVIGGDIGEDQDDSTNLSITVEGPILNYRNITRNGTIAEGGDSILGNNQGQVGENVNVTVNYTSVGGLEQTGHVNVSSWYDEGQDNSYWFENRTGRANYRWKLEYDNSSGNSVWSLVTDHPYDEITYVGAEKLWSNSTTENWTVELSWNKQIKHALPDTGVWGDNASDPDYEGEVSTTFDTNRSWNVNWTIHQLTDSAILVVPLSLSVGDDCHGPRKNNFSPTRGQQRKRQAAPNLSWRYGW